MLSESAGILAQGYHLRHRTFVAKGLVPPWVQLDEGARAIARLFQDGNYVSPYDWHRLIAFALLPAMKLGGTLTADAPILYLEANENGAGKSFLQELIAAIYDEVPFVINVRDKGVGGIDESVAQGMANGRFFIKIDNIETELRSSFLATASTHAKISARVLYRNVEVNPHRHIFMANSNGASIAPELIRRFCLVRIRKREVVYEYDRYLEGDVLAHVKANHSYYLGCVFSVIREWLQAGKPRTDERRHSFRGWAQPADWIMQNIFQTGSPLFGDYGDNGEPPPLGSTANRPEPTVDPWNLPRLPPLWP